MNWGINWKENIFILPLIRCKKWTVNDWIDFLFSVNFPTNNFRWKSFSIWNLNSFVMKNDLLLTYDFSLVGLVKGNVQMQDFISCNEKIFFLLSTVFETETHQNLQRAQFKFRLETFNKQIRRDCLSMLEEVFPLHTTNFPVIHFQWNFHDLVFPFSPFDSFIAL